MGTSAFSAEVGTVLWPLIGELEILYTQISHRRRVNWRRSALVTLLHVPTGSSGDYPPTAFTGLIPRKPNRPTRMTRLALLAQHQGASLLSEPQGLCFARTCESPRFILERDCR